MRRFTRVDVMLLTTVVVWSFNFTVTKYVLTHGLRPLAYSSLRYGAAAVIFAGVTFALERSLAVSGRANLLLLGVSSLLLWANQIAFVYALKLTTATTAALILGTTPVFTAVFARVAGLERLSTRFWVASVLSFGGVVLVAAGSGGELSADLGGNLLAVAMAATWAAYSVLVAPLMRRYSPYRISAIVLAAAWVPLFLTSVPQVGAQDYGSLGSLVWLGLAYAVLGPLVLTNVLWFTAIRRVGPSRATLVANLQPFIAAVFALLLLSEPLGALQIGGGLAIAGSILVARRQPSVAAPAE